MNNNTFSSGHLFSARLVALAGKAIWLSSYGAEFGSTARRHLH